MSMSKKDFEAIARIFRDQQDAFAGSHEQAESGAQTMRVRLAEEMADLLAGTNSRFDRDRFLAACGIES